MPAVDLPPTYEESERFEAEKAMLADLGSPPAYEEISERDRYFYEMNDRMRHEINRNRSPEASTPPPPSPEDLHRWYQQDLADAQRKELQKQYQEAMLNEVRYQALMQRIENDQLRRRLAYQRQLILAQPSYCYYEPTLNDFLLMQLMLRDMPILIEFSWRMNLLILDSAIQVGRFAIPATYNLLASGARGIGSLFGAGNNRGGSNDDAGKIILAIAAIVVFLSAAIAAVFSSAYALKKFVSSVGNILTGNKIVRSLVRISAIAGGAVSGVYGGMAIGAILGSAIPGFGTLAGAILGAALGACINVGVFAFIAKEGMRFISSLFHSNNPVIMNPTNPDKYRLSAHESRHLAQCGVTDTATIYNMMRSIKENKPKKAVFFSDSKAGKANAEYNELLKAVKRNPVVAEKGVYFSKDSLFRWDGSRWEQSTIVRQPAYNPSYRRE